jgi:hypothetical protein
LFHALNFLWGAHVKKAEEGKNAFPNTERELKMKAAAKKWAAGLAAVAGVGAMALGLTAPTPATAQGPSARPGHGQDRHPFRRENQPDINQAIQTLQSTSRDLKRANRDFGGHRARAASLVDQAINELRQAKRYDDTHGNDGRGR